MPAVQRSPPVPPTERIDRHERQLPLAVPLDPHALTLLPASTWAADLPPATDPSYSAQMCHHPVHQGLRRVILLTFQDFPEPADVTTSGRSSLIKAAL